MAAYSYHRRSNSSTSERTRIPVLSTEDAFVWKRRIGDDKEIPSSDIPRSQLASSVVGFGDDVYFVGIYNENVVFSNCVKLKTDTSGLYVAKFNKNGQAIWATSLGKYGLANQTYPETNQEQPPFRLAVTESSIYISGSITSSFSFSSQKSTFNFNEGLPVVIRLTPDGSVKYIRQITGPQTLEPIHICVDNADNAYITGNSEGKVKLNEQLDAIDVTSRTFYVAKIDADGDWQYLVQPCAIGFATVTGLSTDQLGNSHIVGTFTEQLILTDNISIQNDSLASNAFLARIDYRGVWQSITNVTGSQDNDTNSMIVPTSISKDGNSNVYVSFMFIGRYLFGNTIYSSIPTDSQNDLVSLLLVGYDERYKVQWVRRLASNVSSPETLRTPKISDVNARVNVNVKGNGLLSYSFFTLALIEVTTNGFQRITSQPNKVNNITSNVIISFNNDGSYNWLTVKNNVRTNTEEDISAATDNYYVASEITQMTCQSGLSLIDSQRSIDVISNTGNADVTNYVVFLGRLRCLQFSANESEGIIINRPSMSHTSSTRRKIESYDLVLNESHSRRNLTSVSTSDVINLSNSYRMRRYS